MHGPSEPTETPAESLGAANCPGFTAVGGRQGDRAHPHRLRYFLTRTDPQFEEKMAEILELYGTCVATSIPLNDRNNTDPLLNALADNGGPTQTFALQNTSPAINEVRINTGTCPATDQRGVGRPIGPRCDIGAVESPDTTPVELLEFGVE